MLTKRYFKKAAKLLRLSGPARAGFDAHAAAQVGPAKRRRRGGAKEGGEKVHITAAHDPSTGIIEFSRRKK